MREVYVVGYIDNTNGMATWCWEAAHALHHSGVSVVLTVVEGVVLPGEPEMPVLLLPPSLDPNTNVPKSRLSILANKLISLMVARPSPYIEIVTHQLLASHMQPVTFLLNNGALINPRFQTPQYVAGWAYPTDLMGYLAKRNILSRGDSIKAQAGVILELLGYWRSDWRAYRQATGTLAVTQQLRAALTSKGVRAHCLYPCTRLSSIPIENSQGIPKLLMAAESLDDPRKGVRWMLETMAQHRDLPAYELFLVGQLSDDLRRMTKSLPHSVKLLGKLRRDELQTLMATCDIFCFASAMDDWGYVLSEALANGVIPIAPAQSPFDEIIGSSGYSYKPRNSEDFASSLRAALHLTPDERLQYKAKARSQAEDSFSAPAFVRNLQTALGSVANRTAS